MSSSNLSSLKSTLLILDSKPENFRLLYDVFKDHYHLETDRTFDQAKGNFDVCLIEAALIGKYEAFLKRKKSQSEETYLPVIGLLNTVENSENLISRFDEIIRIPCAKTELIHRVENLVRARSLSVDKKNLLSRLRGEVVDLKQERSEILFSEQRAVNLSRQLTLLSDSLPQIVWTATRDGKVDYVNQRWIEYTGLKPEKMKGRDLTFLTHSEDRTAAIEAYASALRSSQPLQFEQRLLRHDGEYRWFSVRAQPLLNNSGNVVHWFGTCTDVDDQKTQESKLLRQTSEAESANRTKSAFLANMSHEIRTPLGVIIGFSSLLKDRDLGAVERDQYIETIIRNGQSLTTIIDDILDLAKVEAGKVTIENMAFSLYDLLNECVDMFKDKARQKGIYVVLNIDDGVPNRILSDPTRLRQILINLIGNATKFTENGGIRVTVRCQPNESNSLDFQILVKDTGIGLTNEQRDRLFHPFAQADETTTRKFGGTGLGLVLSQRLAQALGGNIEILDCAPDQGSTFMLCLRAEPAATPALSTRRRAEIERSRLLEGFSILAVDDSTDNLLLASRLIGRLGATVVTANTGRLALEMCRDQKFSCVLLDIQMPEMDGYETLARLRQQGYSAPVIALTAHAMLEERERTHEAGFDGHVTKPIEQKSLVETLTSVCSAAPLSY